MTAKTASAAPGMRPALGPAFLNIISTKRSGHHALITWLRKGWPGETEFFNNAVIDDRLKMQIVAAARNFSATRRTTFLNYEGVSVAGVAKAIGWQQATAEPVRTIVFLRDPLNTAASLLQRKAVAYLDIVMVARQLFALKAWLELARSSASNIAPASSPLADAGLEIAFYNRWLSEENCREQMAASFGLSSSERTTEVENYGGGSSFRDMASVDEDAARQLVNRWRRHENSSLFRALVSHPEFADIFQAACKGDISDSFSGNDAAADRADYLADLIAQRKPHAYADRMISGLARNTEAFERIEATDANGKKAHILRAHLAALAGR